MSTKLEADPGQSIGKRIIGDAGFAWPNDAFWGPAKRSKSDAGRRTVELDGPLSEILTKHRKARN